MALLHWYKLDGNGNDSAGANNGTAVGTVEYSRASKISGNYSMVCDGGVDYLNTGNWKWQTINFTVSLWFKCNSGQYGYIFSQCKSGSNLNCTSIAVAQDYGYIGYSVVSSSVLYNQGANDKSYADGKWHHVCVVDSNGTVTGYIDSVLHSGFNGSYTRAVIASDNTLIGYFNGANPISFTGYIDDIRHYNSSFSAASVKQLYNSYFTEKAASIMPLMV